MKKFLFYGLKEEKMCFTHLLLNALDLHSQGYEVKIIFEGASVKLVPIFEKEQNKLYLMAKEKNLIFGVCKACSNILGVIYEIENTNLRLLDDMNGHAGMKDFIMEGYEVITM